MGQIKNQFKSEIKQLPAILGKFFGGAMAVIGFVGAIILVTHGSPPPSWLKLLPFLVLGVVGVIVFSLSSLKLKRQLKEKPESDFNEQGKKHGSLVSWAILIIFILIFITVTYVINL